MLRSKSYLTFEYSSQVGRVARHDNDVILIESGNPNMDKQLHSVYYEGCNCLSIS